jgi:hypothetical protein
MKKIMYALILALVVSGGLVFANRETKKAPTKKPAQKPLTAAESKAVLKRWQASPDGIKFKQWEVSPAGKKVLASHDKIRKEIKDFSNMEAIITSVTFQRENAASGPKWLIVNISGEEYMMQFSPKEFEKLSNLKVDDKIIVRSHSAGHSPNHPYLIVSGDYIEQNGKVLFKRVFNNKNKC